MTDLSYQKIHAMREKNIPWDDIKERIGYDGKVGSLRSNYSRWRKREDVEEAIPAGTLPDPTSKRDFTDRLMVEGDVSSDDLHRVKSLDDLIKVFGVDEDEWEIDEFWIRGGSWDQSVEKGTVGRSYRVSAALVRKTERRVEIFENARQALLKDIRAHAPEYKAVTRPESFGTSDDPTLFELAIHDPHIGMLAWGQEVGRPYDSSIAVKDYGDAVEHLLQYALMYPTDRILYVVGHDFLHVDSYAPAMKGSSRGGATAGGTVQDVDSRLAKMFTTARRAVVHGIDIARQVAPVDVIVVPGNHDPQQMYRMAEVLHAWYRNDPEVDVQYGPDKRRWYHYGKNGFLLTHGEEYKRKRDNLAMIFATEAPAHILTEADHWEVHTGHHHIAMGGKYLPTSDLTESRSIRVRALPGITPEDAWHHESGYKHQRAATAMVWRKSGGMAGHHEFTL